MVEPIWVTEAGRQALVVIGIGIAAVAAAISACEGSLIPTPRPTPECSYGVSAGGPPTVGVGTPVQLTGTVADPPSVAFQVTWGLPISPQGSMAEVRSVSPDGLEATFTPDVAGDYVARLMVRRVTAGGTIICEDLATVAITAGILADAGLDYSVDVGRDVTLDAQASSANVTSWTWTVVSHKNLIGGQIGGDWTPPNGTGETFTFVLAEPDSIAYELTVSDGSSSDTDTVIVRSNPPTITSITPSSGAIGDRVTIDGTNFSPTASELNNEVTFGPVVASSFFSASPTQLEVSVPPGATTGPVQVEVLGTGDVSNQVPFTVNATGNWVLKDSGVGTLQLPVRLLGVSFPTASTGWAVGTDGTIIQSTDGGSTWLPPQTSGTTAELWDVAFPVDADTGWAVGQNGTILHTPDGGTTWTPQTSNTAVLLWSVSFVNNQFGAAVGFLNAFGGRTIIVRTTNGGTTWTPDTLPGNVDMTDVYFISADSGWAAGAGVNPLILRTADSGQTWLPQLSIPADAEPMAVTFVDARNGWAVGSRLGSGSMILSTSDGGETWTHLIPAGGGSQLRGVSSAGVGTAVGGGSIFRDEPGSGWIPEPFTSGGSLYAVQMLNATNGVAVGTFDPAAGHAVILRRE
jgi:photosystem II stability/assembly factor-like uncharacterized protein